MSLTTYRILIGFIALFGIFQAYNILWPINQAHAQSPGYGTNLIQRYWEGNASTSPQEYYAGGGFCAGDDPADVNISVDDNGYIVVATNQQMDEFNTDHSTNCDLPNDTYRSPVSMPTVNDGWSLYIILNDNDLSPGTGGSADWYNSTGTLFDTALIASSSQISFGGESYRIYKYGGLVDSNSQGFLDTVNYPNGVSTSLGNSGVVALVYTGYDLVANITTAGDLQDYLDTLYGFNIGNPSPIPDQSRIIEQISPGSLVLTEQSPGSVEFAFSYYSSGNVGRACVYFYYAGTTGWIPSCVESIPNFVGYQAFSLNQDLADDTIYRYYFTIEGEPSFLGTGVILGRTTTGIYSVGTPSVGATNSIWEDMANDPSTWGYSSSTVSNYWDDANISGIYDALDSQCDSRFPVDSSNIITATIFYLPNGMCRLVYGLFFDTSDAQINAGAQSLYDDFMQFPPIAMLSSMVVIFSDLTI